MSEEREDVETTLEQGTTPDASQQKGKWRAIDRIAGSTLVVEVLLSIIWAIVWAFCRFEHQLQVYLALVLIILAGGYLALIFCPIFKKDDDPRWFHARILSSGIVGGSYAFLLPAVMGLEEGSVTSGGAAALRQAILLATGGLIGLVALGETRRKNDNDLKAANELQIRHKETLDQQKSQFKKQIKKQQQQFEANAFKERKAERRERYTKAVEQLGNEKAPVRMGGVYTLIGLVDEWLLDENLDYAEKVREGQVIVNNLCAYIRSSFALAFHYNELTQESPTAEGLYKNREQEFYIDKAEFKSEADIRLSILKEIHRRLQGPDENTPGAWSEFEYDFSGSIFFYPVDLTHSYYTKPVHFSESVYWSSANFSGSTYLDWVGFSDSTYRGRADFSGSTYQGGADFSGSTYRGRTGFGNSIYQEGANLSRSTYWGEADFSGSIFCSEIYFGYGTHSDSFSRFIGCTPQFYDETNHKNTLFGSNNNNFTVENGRGYPVYRNLESLPLGCAFLTAEQKEYLEDKFQEIGKTKNKFREVKDTEGNAILVNTPLSLNGEIRVWREKATTVKAEDNTAPKKEDN